MGSKLPSQLNGKSEHKRKYQPIWELIKKDGSALLTIDGATTMTPAQRESAFCTIRKAIIKEKHEDVLWKRAMRARKEEYQLEISQIEDYRKIFAKLVKKLDPSTLFD